MSQKLPIIESDRGGQVTYHGPGQLVVYFMLNLKQRKLGIKDLVFNLEQSVIELLNHWKIEAIRREGAQGFMLKTVKLHLWVFAFVKAGATMV